MIAIPAVSFAYKLGDPLVPPCSVDSITRQCVWGFTEFMTLIDNVIQFILFALAVPIAAISFAYAGFKLVTSGGSTEARGTAKNVATNTVYGLAFVAGAWLIIKTILTVLGYDGAWIGF